MLTIRNLCKTYGDRTLFQNINCTIKRQDRIGLIGVNGTGKSSLLKAIAQTEPADQGDIIHPKDYQIEYLAQEPILDPQLTVFEQIYYGESDMMTVLRNYEKARLKLAKNTSNVEAQTELLQMQEQMDAIDAWEASTVAKTILTTLGITEFEKKVTELSGGQQKRVALAKSLIQPADLLIMDEPTNHLDHATVEWLEQFLLTYKGALLIVTHDRYFLNRVTNIIFELDDGNLYTYEGNYETFLQKKAEREALEAQMQRKHQNTLRNELKWLRRGARARSTKQKARVERISKMQQQTFHSQKDDVAIQVGSTRLGKQVIELQNIFKLFDDEVILNDVSHLFTPNDRIGIIGPNGSGKTTLLNVIAKRITPDCGHVDIGETVKIGYYTQGDEELDGDMRMIDYIKEVAEVIETIDGSIITAEQMLEHFLFSRSQQWSYIRRLSGGEKRRLYLLKVLMTEPNVLLLDEPTNDLDTQTLGVLEEYLEHFPGVVITVSHDRYFLDRVVDQLLIFKPKGHVEHYVGNYSEYLHEQQEDVEEKQQKKPKAQVRQKRQRKKLSYHEQQEWQVIEDEIMELEEKVSQLQQDIIEAGSDAEKVQTLYDEQLKVEEELEVKIERWGELSLRVEAIEKSRS